MHKSDSLIVLFANQKYWGPIQALLKSSSITIQNQIAKDILITEQR